jgi:uncharacterized protein YbjT (DUF2867 family)
VILVVGATGMVGSEVCRRLAAMSIPARALVRATSDAAKVQGLRDLGIDVSTGDVRDAASLVPACRGVASVISTLSSMPFAYQPGENDITTTDTNGMLQLIDVARAARVRRFIYTSFSGNLDLDFPLHDAKRRVEAHLVTSGVPWTILRPSFFMEVWLSPAVGFDAANARATIYGTGANPISWISLKDVAEFAVRCLDDPAAHNALLELGGPEALTPLQVVRIFEGVSGRRFEVHHVAAEALVAQQVAASDPMAQSFSGLMRCYAKGDPIDMTPVLAAFPGALTSVQSYARTVVRAPVAVV